MSNLEFFADVEKFLTVSQNSQKLEKHGLTARPLEAAKRVRVESLPPTVVKGTQTVKISVSPQTSLGCGAVEDK